jgi:hypothetical protein
MLVVVGLGKKEGTGSPTQQQLRCNKTMEEYDHEAIVINFHVDANLFS